MNRREVVAGLAISGSLAALPSYGQLSNRAKIGFLGNSTAALEANLVDPFKQGLRDQGLVEGRDFVIEYRWAEGDYSRFGDLVAELIVAGVDVIVTAGTPSALAVAKATKTIPCIMVAVGDPVSVGLVESLARPGGNLTGFSSIAPDLEGKRLALLREVAPGLSRLAVIWNPSNEFHLVSERQIRAAAEILKIDVRFVELRTKESVASALASIAAERPDALLILADRVFLHERQRLMDFSIQHKLPGIYAYRELVEAGGLMSYGPSYSDLHRRAASYVAKILKGAKPAELPVEEPSKFELVFNLKAAKVMGVDAPISLLARADEVIE
jgi:putative tryptophan/tyrosine transport system substrate-binding protein